MKPGKVAVLQTKSAADHPPVRRSFKMVSHRIAAAVVILTLWLVPMACSGQFASQAQLTATAARPKTAIAGLSQSGAGAPNPTLPASPLPTMDPPLAPSVTPAATLTPAVTRLPDPTSGTPADSPILYYTQAGDTLKALALRFNVQPSDITSPDQIATQGLFNPGELLLIPHRLNEVSNPKPLLPDSEIVYSPSALDFDIIKYVKEYDGYLSTYKEWRSDGWYDGAGVVHRVAIENSVNPRLLLAILEQQAHWIDSDPQNLAQTDYPIGWLKSENDKKGLYYQLSWAVQQLNIAYYGWREGSLTELTFPDGNKLRLAPELNAGTVSILYLFSRLYNQPEWAGILYGPDSFLALYEKMFGNPWLRSQSVEPLFPATLTQPPLALPYPPGRTWAFTGGPHPAWGEGTLGAPAALDFAPSATVHGCYKSDEWVTASASGKVVRSANGVVVLDLDGDGYEQTGWDIMYLHIATQDRVPLGTFVNLNDHIGHPSCEGGMATGTHVHIARKYNGEWILADGPMPFDLDGWIAHWDKIPYKGYMTNGTQLVIASQVGSFESKVTRPAGDTP